MANQSKYIKLNSDILMEWIFDNDYFVSEKYKIITNLNENKKRSFISTTSLNQKDNNLFQLDSVLKKYTIVDTNKYNFLKEQDYSSSPTQYDKIRIYLPSSYNFVDEGYVGLYLKIYTLDYYNEKIYDLSNIFFDATLTNNHNLINLSIPFIYDEENWGKYYEFRIPSVDFISNQRIISNTNNTVIPNTLNYNLTNGEGVSTNSPIFLEFQYLNTKEIILGNTYYYGSQTYKTSFPKSPEYNTLGVKIEESNEGDFFEIFGTYAGENENMNNFIDEMENKGRKIRIEYDVYLYEENIQTNMQTYTVVDLTKKILYRPILTFSNTTAAIKVTMRVIDLVDMSTINRYATIGLDDNIQKYGKKLLKLNVQNINKLKIYNSKPDEILLGKDYFAGSLSTEIIKVNTPQLIEVGKIIVNSPTSNSDYKGMGLLNIIITPFDNIIQFRLARIPNNNSVNSFEEYDLSDILNNSSMILTFKSDTEVINKNIYNEADNDYQHGIVNFKLIENDLNILRTIYNKGFNNFYLTIISNNTKTLLYSGTYSFFEDVNFIDNNTVSVSENEKVDSSYFWDGFERVNQIDEEEEPKGKTIIIYTKYKNTIN